MCSGEKRNGLLRVWHRSCLLATCCFGSRPVSYAANLHACVMRTAVQVAGLKEKLPADLQLSRRWGLRLGALKHAVVSLYILRAGCAVVNVLLCRCPPFPRGLLVDEHLRVVGSQGTIYCLGDAAVTGTTPQDTLPPTAQVCCPLGRAACRACSS